MNKHSNRCTCGMRDLNRPCKMTCESNAISDDCDVCHRPLHEHYDAGGGHPREWLWDRVTDLEAEVEKSVKYTQQYTEELQLAMKVNEETEQKLKRTGDLLDETLTANETWQKRHHDLSEALRWEKIHHKNDRQVIIEHTGATELVKKVFGLDKTDPLDDQLFEVACQRVMSAVKVYNAAETPSFSPKERMWTPALKLHEARDKIQTAMKQMRENGPGSALAYLRIAMTHLVESMEQLANAEAHDRRAEAYKEGMRDARNGCVCDKQPGKCPAHDIIIDRHIEGLGTDE